MKRFLFIFLSLVLSTAIGNAQTCIADYLYTANGLSVNFSDTSTSSAGNITSYSWSFGDGNTSSQAKPSHTYQQAGAYNVCLNITTSLGCRDSYCDTIIVNTPCVAKYSYQVDTATTVTFVNQSASGPGVSYTWDFGDGSPFSSLQNPVHFYNTPGAYTVNLSVNDNGITCSYFDTVFVDYCLAFFTYSFPPGNGNVQFHNYSQTSRSTYYRWDFGDGNITNNVKHPSHVYSQSGSYEVTLQLFDSLSFCASSMKDTVQVVVNPPCTAGFNIEVFRDSISITSTASNFTSITYSFGDGDSSSQINPGHLYSQNGSYIICQTVSNPSTSCIETFCDTVIIPACSANFSYSTNYNLLSIQSNASSFSFVAYDFGDGTISFQENPSHTYTQAGSYRVCQSIIDTNSSCQDTYCDTVQIIMPCNAGFTYTNNEDSLFISNTASNYDSLIYFFGDGNSSNDPNPFHIYTQSGTYTVKQLIFGQGACMDSTTQTVNITIPPPCQAGFTYSVIGDTIQFNSAATSYNRLVYYFGDGDSSTADNPLHAYQNSNTYTVTQVVYNDARACIDSLSKTISVNVSSSCVARYQLAVDTNKRSTLFLINTSTNDNTHSYRWTFGDGAQASGRTPTHQYSEFKQYMICLTVSDSIQNCTSTYCDSVGLDSNGRILKSGGFMLRVINGSFIGIEEESYLNELKIYPNPINDRVIITHPAYKRPITYQIFNLKGQLVLEGKLNTGFSEIDFSSQQKGLYLLRLRDKKRLLNKRLLKN
jgi:PKD repeat protein